MLLGSVMNFFSETFGAAVRTNIEGGDFRNQRIIEVSFVAGCRKPGRLAAEFLEISRRNISDW